MINEQPKGCSHRMFLRLRVQIKIF